MLFNSVPKEHSQLSSKKTSDAATAAEIKLEKYFDGATGIHPGLSFMILYFSTLQNVFSSLNLSN